MSGLMATPETQFTARSSVFPGPPAWAPRETASCRR